MKPFTVLLERTRKNKPHRTKWTIWGNNKNHVKDEVGKRGYKIVSIYPFDPEKDMPKEADQ